MALSRPAMAGQTVVLCHLCEEENQIKGKCLTCDFLMCSRCCKIHQKLKSSDEHWIVDVKDIPRKSVKSPLVKPDFSVIKCNEHKGQSCCLFCRDCEEPACLLCIAKIHNRHDMIEIKEQYNLRRETIKLWVSKLDEETTRRENCMATIKSIRNTKERTFETEKGNILNQEKALKQAVGEQTEKLLSDLSKKWTSVQKSLNNQEVSEKIGMQVSVKKKDDLQYLLESNDVAELFRSFKGHCEFFQSETQPTKLDYQQLPKFVKGKIAPVNVEALYGTLKYGSDIGNPDECIPKMKIEVIEHCVTPYQAVQTVICCMDGSLWIKNRQQRKLQNVTICADRLSVSVNKSFDLAVYDMVLTSTGDLLLSTLKSELRIIPCSSGKNKVSNYDVSPLYTSAVYAAKDGKVFVGAVDSGPDLVRYGASKVIVMDSKGNHETVYNRDTNGRHMFTFPRRITLDSNNNIYVIDQLTDKGIGRVVIFGHNEQIRGIYTGDVDIKFSPCNLLATSSNTVIVSDYVCSMLHFLNSDGQCLSIQNTTDIGISGPLSLDIDKRGMLYIGCFGENIYIVKINEM